MQKINFSKKYIEEDTLIFLVYLYWQNTDKKRLKRINALLKDIARNPFEGLGKPEPLKYKYSGFWSRQIDDEHRLIYKYKEAEIQIAKCRYHYD